MKTPTVALLALAGASALAAPGGSVVGSKHDLSVTGPGPIRALSEGNPCVFCHIPHGAREGLSSRPDPAVKHRPYESSTLAARPGAPTGASRICLSCHDGTIAVGRTLHRDIPMTIATIPAGRRSNVGTDLRRSHPISFQPASGSRTRAPVSGEGVRLDRTGQVQCTSCHDPHVEYVEAGEGQFLVRSVRRSALCLTCHDPTSVEGVEASHAASAAPFGPAEGNDGGFASVGEAGCAACHVSHGGELDGRLVRKPPADDDGACLRCHASTVTRVNIGGEVSKPHAHGGQGRGAHDAAEGRGGKGRALPETSPGAARHAVCVDCHDPHRATNRPAVAPGVSGALAGVWGIDQTGLRVEQVQFEHEVCFKCHGDSANKPQSNGPRPPETVRRAIPEANLRLVFAPSAPSFHPVVAPGRNLDVPSLVPAYTAASLISCGDCHASENGPGVGGAGPRGPHGSIYPHLLERNYATADLTAESASAYALCYKCHDREKLFSDPDDAFRRMEVGVPRSLHRLHVRDRLSPCSSCHDAHGVSSRVGTPSENAHLVNLDLSIVGRGGGSLGYRTYGPRSGSCALACHGETHSHTTHGY